MIEEKYLGIYCTTNELLDMKQKQFAEAVDEQAMAEISDELVEKALTM